VEGAGGDGAVELFTGLLDCVVEVFAKDVQAAPGVLEARAPQVDEEAGHRQRPARAAAQEPDRRLPAFAPVLIDPAPQQLARGGAAVGADAAGAVQFTPLLLAF